MLIELIKTALTIPSGINGLVAGRGAYKATTQLKRDIALLMKRGITKVDQVLSSATPDQQKKARQEFKKWSPKRKGGSGLRKFKICGCPPVHHVQQLFSLQPDIAAALAVPGVYLDPKLRDKISFLNNRLKDYQLSYANHQNTRFHYARCYILREKMEAIKLATGF
ncbi:hypothetical protein MXM51_22835 [Pantoea stewartii]|uniref:hypothetical protein n=1 Tax=Pantoea stewartii TaxID=66269 RepID=UPI002DB62F93|nr:hypothetical protein [Pantoea stewartii]MEB6537349.1 hypothetical protein [Pantoea stewartii]